MTDYDSPATFRGQLRRGRGIAVQRATTEPHAAEMVYECVFEDVRWDRLCDTRGGYLAGLIHRLDLSLAPIERRLAAAEDLQTVEYCLDVLAHLPFVGRADAASVLRRYAAEGRHRQAALDAIADEVTASRKANQRPGAERRARRRTAAEVSTDELDRDIAAGGRERALALEELGRRGDQRVMDFAEQTCLYNAAAWIPGMSRALGHLGTAAVPRARAWSAGDNPTLAHFAVTVLAEHGDVGDVEILHAALNSYVAEEDWCGAEKPARGLGRLGAQEAISDLMAAWEATPHSLARVDFLQALIACRAPQAAACAEEGLFDCEPEVQQIARASTDRP